MEPPNARAYATGVADQAQAAAACDDGPALADLIERVRKEQGSAAAIVLGEHLLAHARRRPAS